MKKIKIDKNKIRKEEADLIVDFLNSGKVILYPTDTIYGLGCLATDPRAIKEIFKIKKREKGKPLLVLVSSLAMAKKYCHIDEKQKAYLEKIWPGPTTTLLKHKGKLPGELTAGSDSLAIRLPKDDFLIKMIRRIRVPLVSTSANLSGRENLTRLGEVEKYFLGAKPDLAIDAGELKGKPSRLMDLRNIKNIKILRK